MQQALPIDAFLSDIHNALSTHKNLVLQAEPGAGKSTAVPFSLLNLPRFKTGNTTKIVMLEPRKLAAKSIAHYLATQLGEPLGQRVGYHVKNDKKTSPHTCLEIVTEGILTRRIQQDPELSDISIIIFDEFHERSLQADLGLMLTLEIQQALREDLQIVVMSATIDTQLVANYLDNTAIIHCPGRSFPVETHYNDTKYTRLSEHVLHALKTALADNTEGDVLVFLPGQSDIHRCLQQARSQWQNNAQLIFLPLYGSLNLNQQEQAIQLDTQGKRRVIFTTNIAETSLTIEGVSWVIDSGLEKRTQYDPSSGLTRLETVSISKASAEQRKGRAGRVKAGHCIRLWSQVKQAGLIEFQPEEIKTTDLSDMVLNLYAWGLNNFDTTPWLTAPPLGHYQTADTLLQSLKLIDKQQTLTTLGQKVVHIGLHPRLASLLFTNKTTKTQELACYLAALLSEQDIFNQSTHTDIALRMIAVQDYIKDKKRALKHYNLKYTVIETVMQTARNLARLVGIKPPQINGHIDQHIIAQLLLTAYPDRLAKRRPKTNRYLLANGKGVCLSDEDNLNGSEWLIVCDCDGQKREGRIYTAIATDSDTVIALCNDQFTIEEDYSLDAKKQKIIGRKITRYRAITIREENLGTISKNAFKQCIKQLIKTEGLTLLNWNQACTNWLTRAQWLGEQSSNFRSISAQALQNTANTWLLPYISHVNSLSALKKLDVLPLIQSLIDWEDQQRLDKEAPANYTSPSGKTVPIIYDKDQGPTVSIILQEMFGELRSPTLAFGKVPLRFELLSPARRPIQTTSDLANFWQSSYFDVAKDMRGQYPKHRWPEQPLLEKPGKSYKPRKKKQEH